jgi:DNA helicase IV
MRTSGLPPTVVHTDDVETEVKRITSDNDDRLTAVVAPADLAGQLDAMTVAEVKGLEFDRVIVVEPAALAREAGLTGLYVALTRTTSELVIVHGEELPAAMS